MRIIGGGRLGFFLPQLFSTNPRFSLSTTPFFIYYTPVLVHCLPLLLFTWWNLGLSVLNSEGTWRATHGQQHAETRGRDYSFYVFVLPCLSVVYAYLFCFASLRCVFYNPRVYSLGTFLFLRPTCLSRSALLEFPPVFPRFSGFRVQFGT